MTGRSGRYEPGSQVARPRSGVESPMRPVLGGSGGLRQHAGMIAVAAFAVTIVAAGIGVAGGLEPGPDPSGSAPSPADASGSPGASGATKPAPTKKPVAGCVEVDPANLPEVRLWSTRGESDAVQGTERLADSPDGSPGTGLGWPAPGVSSTFPLSHLSSIVLIPDDDACIREVSAEFLPETAIERVPVPLGVGEFTLNPPRNRVVLGSLPGGTWIVRIVASYSTRDAAAEDPIVIERFFRVLSEEAPEVPPEVTPAVPCPTVAAGAPPPDLLLLAGDGVPVRGVNLATYPGDVLHNGARVAGTFPDRLLLLVEGEVCATAWTIQWLDQRGSPINELTQVNEDQNPYRVSQNRIDLTGGPIGEVVISATLEFGPGRTARGAWEVTMAAPPVPVVTVAGPRGAAVNAVPGCGASWSIGEGHYDDGYVGGPTAYEGCSNYGIPDGVQLITVRSGEALTVDVPGSTLQSWNVVCGIRGGVNGRDFMSGGSCDLGGAERGPVKFLPFDGTSIIQIQIGTIRDGVSTYAQYFVDVLAGP